MKPSLLLRIATGCMLFFALGHSMGHFNRHDVMNLKAKAVLKMMSDDKFDMFGQVRSYDENYTGMSLNLIITLITIATVLLILSYYTETQAKLVRSLLFPIVFCTLSFAATGFKYFFPVPAITCLVASGLIIWAIMQLGKEV